MALYYGNWKPANSSAVTHAASLLPEHAQTKVDAFRRAWQELVRTASYDGNSIVNVDQTGMIQTRFNV